MNKMEQTKIKEVPIWTAQMLDLWSKKGLKVLDKEVVVSMPYNPNTQGIPKNTKRVIVIYLG